MSTQANKQRHQKNNTIKQELSEVDPPSNFRKILDTYRLSLKQVFEKRIRDTYVGATSSVGKKEAQNLF